MLTLVTIPVSHYCEKARWALDRANLSYREEAHLPLFHLAAVRRAGGRRTVPVLVTPEGSIRQSTDILRWVDGRLPSELRLFPDRINAESSELERWLAELDAELGVDSRLWAYAQLLPHKPLVIRYGTAGAPRWEAHAARLSYPLLRRMMTKKLGITRASIAQAEQRMERLLDRVDALLQDGRPCLLGDRFTAADLALAALAAPLVSPSEYHVPLPQPEEMPPDAAARVRAWRERPSGGLVLRLYHEHRRRVLG